MKVACQFRLGLPIRVLADADLIGESCPHQQCTRVGPDGVRYYVDVPFESCASIVDQFGDHTIGCKTGRQGRIGRHDTLVYALRRLIENGGAHVTTGKALLKRHMQRFDAEAKHYTPDGVATFCDGSPDIVWDNAVTGFEQGVASDTDAGAAVRNIEQDKYYKYQSALRAQPPVIPAIHPVVQDSAGRMGPAAIKLFKALATRRAEAPDRPEVGGARLLDQDAAMYLAYMLQIMGVTLMRCQSDVLLRAARLGRARALGASPADRGWVPGGPVHFDGTWAATFGATLHG